jgi:hypothetical protein
MIDFQQAIEIFKTEKLEFGNPKHIQARNVFRHVTRSAPKKYEALRALNLELRQKYG